MNHRMAPVPRELHEPERGPLWQCQGCGLRAVDPSEVVGDCTALALFDTEES